LYPSRLNTDASSQSCAKIAQSRENVQIALGKIAIFWWDYLESEGAKSVVITVGKILKSVLMCDSGTGAGNSVIRERALGDFTSTTEHTPLVSRCFSERQMSIYPQDLYIFSDPDFSAVVQECEAAILQGVYPRLSKKGSSGSYFVTNLAGVCCIS